MGNKQLPCDVKSCVECIEPENYDEGYNRRYVKHNQRIYKAYIADDSDGFESDMCRCCDEGLVPEWLPREQVIRYIKNIFEKHDLQI